MHRIACTLSIDCIARSTFDQFSNLVLRNCFERRFLDKQYADESLGLYLIKGEQVVCMGTMVSCRTSIKGKRIDNYHSIC